MPEAEEKPPLKKFPLKESWVMKRGWVYFLD